MTLNDEYPHKTPAPAKTCVWCNNSHMADSRSGCSCEAECGVGWCLIGCETDNPFTWRAL